MKRARRITIARGLPGTVRRRCARMLRAMGTGALYVAEAHEMRDARRLADAGLVAAAVSKAGFIGRREIAVFASLQEAKRLYPWTVLPQKRTWYIDEKASAKRRRNKR